MIAFAHDPHTTPGSPADLERLGDEIARLAAHLHAATYRLLVLIREFDEREGWGPGFRSCAQWLSWRTGIGPGAAREKVRVARALAVLPGLSEAMARGELSFSKVRALTRVANPDNEKELLEVARHATAAQIVTLVKAWRRVDRLQEAGWEEALHQSRSLRLYVEDDGMVVIRGRLDPEVGAVLERALEWAGEALYRQDRAKGPESGNVSAETSPAEKSTDDRPTAEQRRADALALLAERALAADRDSEPAAELERDGNGGRRCQDGIERQGDGEAAGTPDTAPTTFGRADRFQVVVHVDAPVLNGSGAGSRSGSGAEERENAGHLPGHGLLAELGIGVSAETSRRLACDADLVSMTHDRDGRVLDVGRKRRTVPPALRRALDYRDRGCRFPGCGSRYTDAHHVRHWAHGGETKLDNLVLLCRRHHRAVHEGGVSIEMSEGGEVTFRKPSGERIPAVPVLPPPPDLPADPVDA
ncbi:MAG: DUF222 domain-containing protein, partial [Gemmatimonadota bacterium]